MFDLRYYQQESIDAVYREWESVQSTCIIAATATGKTEIYLSIAASYPGRVLVVAHRDYLLGQPIRRLAAHGFDDVGIEKAEHRSEGRLEPSKVVFASIQSLCKEDRLKTFDPFSFSAIIVDEGHRAVSKTYRTVLDHFRTNPRLRILILTATPKRKDGIALGNVCESVAYTYGPKTAMNEGWIVPLKFYRRTVEGLDFSTVKLKGSDLDQEQVERLLMQEKPLHEVCSSLALDCGPTVIFCPGVMIARAYHTLMNERYRQGRSAVLWQESDEEERETVGKKLANGEIDYLFNCDLVTEGYDIPELVRVVWAAPTASLVRFTQGTGRVFRTHSSLRGQLTGDRAESDARKLLIQQSPKPVGHVVTYYPQNCTHQLCEPNDILGGEDLPAEVKAYAKQIQEQTAAQPGGSDPDEDVETAQAVVELRSLLELRRQKIKAEAAVRDTEYDAFGGGANRTSANKTNGERDAVRRISDDWPNTKPASDKQKAWFHRKGIHVELTAWRAFVVRDLVEKHGIKLETAMGYSKNQALAVKEKYEKAAS